MRDAMRGSGLLRSAQWLTTNSAHLGTVFAVTW